MISFLSTCWQSGSTIFEVKVIEIELLFIQWGDFEISTYTKDSLD